MRRDQSTTNDNEDNKKNKKILLVDDEPDITRLVRMVLEDNGFVVESYTDPTLALSNFKPGLYDLLLLDIKMPKIIGLDLYQKMSGIDSNVKICFLTARNYSMKNTEDLMHIQVQIRRTLFKSHAKMKI